MKWLRVIVLGSGLWATTAHANTCEIFGSNVQDTNGHAVKGAQVTIKLAGTQTLATLYSSQDCTATIDNPVTTGTTGEWSAYIKDGRYDIYTAKTGLSFQTKFNVPVFLPLGQNEILIQEFTDTLDICAPGIGMIAKVGSTPLTVVINEQRFCTQDATAGEKLVFRFVGTGKITRSPGITLTINSPSNVIAPPTQQIFDGDGATHFAHGGTVHPGWWGAKGDDVTDSTVAFQSAASSIAFTDPVYSFTGAVHLAIQPGFYRISAPIDLPAASLHLQGSGKDITFIRAVGTTAFTIKTNATTGSVLEGFTCLGDNTATKACFDTTPTNTSHTVAKNTWRDIRIIDFPRAFIVPNVQICNFLDLQVDGPTSGVVFYIHPTADGMQANANRVERLQVTGQDVQVWDVSLTSTRRAANWTLRDSDMQQTGTVAPITISDSGYLLENIEFENSSANHLVVLTADNNLAAYYTTLSHLLLYGGAGGANGKIHSTTTGSQYAYYVTVMNCDAGSNSDRLIDFTNGRAWTFLSNQGVISGDGNGFNFYGQNSDTFTSYTDGDTTPSVRGLTQLTITNSVGTTITDFDDGVDQQEVTLIFTDANTTLTDGGNLALAGGFTSTANDTLTIRRAGTTWYEVRRSVN